MPRKTRYELEAERQAPQQGTEAYWRVKRIEASARKQMLEAKHRDLLIKKLEGDLITRDEVREMFTRVFSAYRQATREIDRRYGPDAAAILITAEHSALRIAAEDDVCQPNT